ncbi:MAG: WhiB family transcriptional regulator [Actinomycetes bacterium]
MKLFQHPLLEDPPPLSAPAEEQRAYATLEGSAERLCAACPLQPRCLYDAVIRFDITGYVAGTTARQRSAIRRRLGVSVPAEDLDILAGVVAGNRPIDHDEVVRLRHANPHESLETLARRLGCSLSTVKRHLRAERNAASRPQPRPTAPDPDAVLLAYAAVTGGRPSARTLASSAAA